MLNRTIILGLAADPGPPWQHGWMGPWWHAVFWPLGMALVLGATILLVGLAFHHFGHHRHHHHHREAKLSEVGPRHSTWSPSTAKGPPGVLGSDHERDATVSVISQAIAEGRLSFQEGEERIQSAYTARYRDDLATLVKDLPSR